MKNSNRWFLSLILVGFGGAMTVPAAYAQYGPVRKDVQERLAKLHQAKNILDTAKTDLGAAKRELAAAQQTPSKAATERDLQARMNKDRSIIRSSVVKILDDANYLETYWSLLSQDERNFVSTAQKDLG